MGRPSGSTGDDSKDRKRLFVSLALSVQLLNNHKVHMQFRTKIALSALQLFSGCSRTCLPLVGHFCSPLASLWVTNAFTEIKLLAVIACAKVKSLLPW